LLIRPWSYIAKVCADC